VVHKRLVVGAAVVINFDDSDDAPGAGFGPETGAKKCQRDHRSWGAMISKEVGDVKPAPT
jgi:hypothetical protein